MAEDRPLFIPVILGTTIFGTLIIVVTNLIVDIVYGLLDPRVRQA